ncbi:MAG TPA: ABC transporter ATP-binding protein [Gemmatimonadaceae bacterium]|nr:ABC transporter ATP-binding protein [Gemmatimonadaceae bacterium]
MIELSHVTKTYAPRLGPSARAVDDVSLRVGAGEIAGLSGPAGAGKSTLISMILGFERPSSGTVRIDGIEPRRFVEREGVAFVPQRVGVPGRWRVADALRRLAILSGVPVPDVPRQVDAAIEELGLEELRRIRLRALSRDARTRVGIAQAILTERRVVILDEPLDGVEPLTLDRLQDLIVRLRAANRAILIASRDTVELQRIVDRVTLIDRGRVRRAGASRPATPADVEAVYHISVHRGGEQVIAVFPSAISLGRGTYAVRVMGLGPLNLGLRELLERGVLLASVAPAHVPVEAQAFSMGEVAS